MSIQTLENNWKIQAIGFIKVLFNLIKWSRHFKG